MSFSDGQFFSATDVGRKRAHNEDNYLVDKELGLYVVADGMGGHAAGEVASAIAVHCVHDVLQRHRHILEMRLAEEPADKNTPRVGDKEVLALLEFAVGVASARIHEEAKADKSKRGMGTTMSLLLVVGTHGYVAHVGDSRIYLWRNSQLRQVTEDHTVANELARMGKVLPENLANVPSKNAITRAVGVYEHVDVDTLTVELLAGDEFILCSDGLSGYFDDTEYELSSFLNEHDGNVVVSNLIGFANEQGGKDNITAVLVRLGPGDLDEASRAHILRLKRDFLSSLPLFERLDERQLLHIMQLGNVCQFEQGAAVVEEGTSGDEMFVVLEGELSVTKGNTTVSELGPGAQFGEMALIRSLPRSATVTATRPSRLLAFRRDDFFRLVRHEERIAVKLLWQLLVVVTDRLDTTTSALRGARDELEAEDITAFADSEDPFRPAPPTMALGGLPLRGAHEASEQTLDSAAPHAVRPKLPPPSKGRRAQIHSSSLRPGAIDSNRSVTLTGLQPLPAVAAVEVRPAATKLESSSETMEWHPSETSDKAVSPAPPAAEGAAASADATLRSITGSDRDPQRSGKSNRITIPDGHSHDELGLEAARTEGGEGGSAFVPTKITLPLNDEKSQTTLQQVREEVKRIQREQAAADEKS